MTTSKTQCSNCGRQVSKSNAKSHKRACLGLTDSESLVLLEDRKRAATTKANKAKALKEKRITDASFPFELLNEDEQRERIRREQTKQCSMCLIPEEWNGKPLKFDLDHIDGDRSNNHRTNLRLVCPNCHSQTSTYKVGNNKQPGSVVYSEEMIVEALKSHDSAYKAMKSLGMNPHGGNYTRLRNIVKRTGLNLPYSF